MLSSGRSSRVSEVHERVTVLGQLVYSELDMQLAVGIFELTCQLFRYEWPVSIISYDWVEGGTEIVTPPFQVLARLRRGSL